MSKTSTESSLQSSDTPLLPVINSRLSGVPWLSSGPHRPEAHPAPEADVVVQSPEVLPEALRGPRRPELRRGVLHPPQCYYCKDSQLLARPPSAEQHARLEVGERRGAGLRPVVQVELRGPLCQFGGHAGEQQEDACPLLRRVAHVCLSGWVAHLSYDDW